MTRAENVAEARRLRAEGLSYQEIADRMSRKYKTVWTWLNDPELAEQRRRRAVYAGACVDCGKATDGSRGYRAPERCRRCAAVHNTKWGKAGVVAAIHRFAERYGRPPTSTDFSPSCARHLGHEWRSARFHSDGDYPYSHTVVYTFGTWNAAIIAAGFEPPGPGLYKRQPGAVRAAYLEAEREAA